MRLHFIAYSSQIFNLSHIYIAYIYSITSSFYPWPRSPGHASAGICLGKCFKDNIWNWWHEDYNDGAENKGTAYAKTFKCIRPTRLYFIL